MSPHERGLLDAIIANPADDTVRLVYADWLDEHDQPARAEFIRVQIEVGQHHPDSARHAELDRRAESLLAEHWIDWWKPVCEVTGLRPPETRRESRLGRLAQAVRLAAPEGRPYWCEGLSIGDGVALEWGDDMRATRSIVAHFRQGFPESLDLLAGTEPARHAPRWPTVSPLARLQVTLPGRASWANGPYLGQLRELRLEDYEPGLLAEVLGSPHLDRLDSLEICYHDIHAADVVAPEVQALVAHPRARQLRRLSVPAWNEVAIVAVANAPSLAGLTGLTIGLQSPEYLAGMDYYGYPATEVANRGVQRLSRSPDLAGLRELTIDGVLGREGYRAVTAESRWKNLRKLTLTDDLFPDQLAAIFSLADLPALEELRLGMSSLGWREIEPIVRSALLKQLRHFAVSLRAPYYPSPGQVTAGLLGRLGDALDSDRIETFSLTADPAMAGLRELRDRFGPRLRLPRGEPS